MAKGKQCYNTHTHTHTYIYIYNVHIYPACWRFDLQCCMSSKLLEQIRRTVLGPVCVKLCWSAGTRRDGMVVGLGKEMVPRIAANHLLAPTIHRNPNCPAPTLPPSEIRV